MRTFLSATLPRWSGVLSSMGTRSAALSDGGLQLAFRRVCAEEGVQADEGLPEDALAAALAATGQDSVEDLKALLRSSPSFRVEAGRVHMTTEVGCVNSQVELMLRKVAAKLPSTSVTGSQFRAIVEDEAPYFQPSAVGALSLKEVLQRHPHLFLVDTDATGKWTVRSAAAESDGGTTRGVSNSLRIVDACRRKVLAGHRNEFTSLRVLMREENITSKGVLRDLMKSDDLNKHLQIRFSVKVRPKRAVVNAHCFVDGDEIGIQAVDAMWKEMNLSAESTRLVARQSSSHKHSSADIIAPGDMPTYAVLERRVRELALSQPVILRDIIYMCSLKQFSVYADHVAKLNPFPDADVYVCCPSKVRLVAGKRHVPM
uniref:Uncharacterized protein n=1 Tax=Trypanosoma congolense (strain IL3000) TaxID=1068625 RepID=G0UJ26_TRYCI|nr:conserved hypothetical protein [Trypanosoma congolense IL3000]